jgi:hypothetical protein
MAAKELPAPFFSKAGRLILFRWGSFEAAGDVP